MIDRVSQNNDNPYHPMKPLSLLFTCALLISTALPAIAQKVDYRTFEVIAKSGNISIVVKDNDYRMVVGSINKPKTVFLLGYSKEQASLKIRRLIRICENDQYTFVREEGAVKFVLKRGDLLVIREALEMQL